MPSTVVHAALAVLLGAALLRGAYDRRAVAVVVLVAILPDLDSLAGYLVRGAHRALGHTLLIPFVVVGLLLYDTQVRETSWLRGRYGDWGVHVVWVLLFTHTFAHVLLDYAHLDGINLFYPLYDRFFRLEGETFLSTTDGIVQTFVDIELDPETGESTVDAGSTGTTDDVHVPTPVQPEPDTDVTDDVERIFTVAYGGWQLYVVLLGLFTMAAKRLQVPAPEEFDAAADEASGVDPSGTGGFDADVAAETGPDTGVSDGHADTATAGTGSGDEESGQSRHQPEQPSPDGGDDRDAP